MSAPHIITLVGYFSIRPGKAQHFRDNCRDMVALNTKEPGLLGSAYSFDGDTSATSREDYDSAEAVVRHMKLGQHIFQSTQQLVDITGVEIYGPSDELDKLRDLLADQTPRFFVTEFGFRR